MSDTPRTDKEVCNYDAGRGRLDPNSFDYVSPDFARTLERELAEQKRLHCETITQRTAVTAERDAFRTFAITSDDANDKLRLQLASERAARSDALIAAVADIERLTADLATATATNHAMAELTKDTGDDSLFNVRRLRNELRIAGEQLTTAKAALEIIGNECLDCRRIAREALAKIK